MAYRIQFRRDTSTNWESNNPILLGGEFGYELDTGYAKIGDGQTPWMGLEYFGGTGPTGPIGPNGPTGPEGPTGPPGTNGTSGTSGYPGTNGSSGTSGSSGSSGTSGLSGSSGTSGSSGSSGTSGANGTSGTSGFNSSGTGIWEYVASSLGATAGQLEASGLDNQFYQTTNLYINQVDENNSDWYNYVTTIFSTGKLLLQVVEAGNPSNIGLYLADSANFTLVGSSMRFTSLVFEAGSGSFGNGAHYYVSFSPYSIGSVGPTGATGSNGTSGTSGTSFSSPYTGNLNITSGQAWVSSYGATAGIDWNSGNIQTYTLSSSTTFTFSNPHNGATYILVVRQSSGGGDTVTWPSVSWAGGNTPVMTATADKYDIYTFVYVNSIYYGSYAQDFT